MKGLSIMVAVIVASAAAPCYAACDKDTDCKGDRLCVRGVCESPPKVEPEKPGDTATEPSVHWRHGPYLIAGGFSHANYDWAKSLGFGYALEYGHFYAYLEILPAKVNGGDGFGNMVGGGLGLGYLVPLNGYTTLGIAGAFGFWESTAGEHHLFGCTANFLDPNCQPELDDDQDFRVMLTPFIRFGRRWTVTAGPRIGIGTRSIYNWRPFSGTSGSSVEKVQYDATTLGVTLQFGYMFGTAD